MLLFTQFFFKKRLENDKGNTCILIAVVAITDAEVVDVVVVATTTAAASIVIRTCIVTPDRDALLLTHRSSDGSLPGTLEYST